MTGGQFRRVIDRERGPAITGKDSIHQLYRIIRQCHICHGGIHHWERETNWKV